MRFLLTAADTDGELLRIETRNPPTGIAEPMHVHPRQETSAEVLSGTLRFVVDGRERQLAAGDTITIPAGARHRFWNAGDIDAVAIQEARPALRLAEFFEAYFALAANGELDEEGRPSLLRSAVLGPEFADEIRLVTPPWPIQHIAYTMLGPLARLRGSRSSPARSSHMPSRRA